MTSFINLINDVCNDKPGAYDLLATCLMHGLDPDKKPISSEFILQIVNDFEGYARQGNVPAMVALGNIYLNGWNVPKDAGKALDYARRSASLGNAGGEILLGYMYANGLGVSKDYDRAMQWFKSGLEKGHIMAANNIGAMYEFGLGVKKDLNIAIKYYQQAAKQNNALAIQNIERLTGKKL